MRLKLFVMLFLLVSVTVPAIAQHDPFNDPDYPGVYGGVSLDTEILTPQTVRSNREFFNNAFGNVWTRYGALGLDSLYAADAISIVGFRDGGRFLIIGDNPSTSYINGNPNEFQAFSVSGHPTRIYDVSAGGVREIRWREVDWNTRKWSDWSLLHWGGYQFVAPNYSHVFLDADRPVAWIRSYFIHDDVKRLLLDRSGKQL